jgi:sugar phosphate permease
MRKVRWRFIPFLIAAYFIAYIDRVNVGFAALTMNADIGLSYAAFGLGGSLFFIAYILFEVPSSIGQQRYGSRFWISRIMVTWGIVGCLMAMVSGPVSFYILRFLLGAAEAGFFPGVVFFLSRWFPSSHRARVIAAFMIAIPVSNMLGSPLSAALLGFDGVFGLKGWQWLFLVESIPAILLGLFALRVLCDEPVRAAWLTTAEREWLSNRLSTEKILSNSSSQFSWRALLDKRIFAFSVVYCGSSAASNALSLWQPQILGSFGLSTWETALYNMLPFAAATVCMLIWSRIADGSLSRNVATAVPLALTAAALFGTLVTTSLSVTLVLLGLALIGVYSLKGPFWSMVTEALPTPIVGAGLAAINSLAHIWTSVSVALVGLIRQQTGSFAVGLAPLAIVALIGCVIIMTAVPGKSRSTLVSS